MNPQRTWAVARMEFLHVLRDPRALGIGIAMPMLMLLLFGYALTLDVDNVPLVVWDQSKDAASRDFVARFSGSPYFQLVGAADRYGDIEKALDRGDALVGLILPPDFARAVATGRPVTVQLVADGSDANTARLAIGYADSIGQAYSQEVILEVVRRRGGSLPAFPVDFRPRVWFNTDLESRNFIVPGLIAVIMMIIAALLTSLTVAREWETGTMEQVISTPLRPAEIVFGKLVPYFAIGLIDMVISVLVGRYLFGVPLRGSVALLFVMASVFLAGGLGIGLLVSIAAKSQLLASQVAFVVTFLPAFLLSGFMYDVRNMPVALQYVTYLVPARYFVNLLRGIYLKGVCLQALAAEAVFLVAFTVLILGLALAKFKKRME
jgi:ABC-2 type transport system permease protein